MTSWFVVLLRGVNVGKANRIAMPVLSEVLERLGGREVRTYLQSGNAVLSWDGAADDLERQTAAALFELGLDVPVLVRTGTELAGVVEDCPWPVDELDPKLLHVAFLAGEPDPARLAAIDHAALQPERLAVGDRVLYLFHAEGVRASRLARTSFGVAATARNWTTVTALRELSR